MRQLIRDVAAFMHWYPGHTWEVTRQMRVGAFEVLVREAYRQQAREDHRAILVAHSSDVKDLEERTRYAAFPEQAYWTKPADDDIESFFAGVRKP